MGRLSAMIKAERPFAGFAAEREEVELVAERHLAVSADRVHIADRHLAIAGRFGAVGGVGVVWRGHDGGMADGESLSTGNGGQR